MGFVTKEACGISVALACVCGGKILRHRPAFSHFHQITVTCWLSLLQTLVSVFGYIGGEVAIM